MTSPAPHFYEAPTRRGFTLIEVLVTVVIVAILAAIALPSFQASIRKGRRSDAFTSIAAVQQAQERWRGNNQSYTASLAAPPAGLGISGTTTSGYYNITVTNVAPNSYDALATAVSGTSQAEDGDCKVIGAQMNGGNVIFGSGAGGVSFAASSPDTGKCWAR